MWTPERVGEELVAEMRAMQGGATILTRGSETGRPFLDLSGLLLGDKSVERKQLLSWANCQARECSFSERCREFGWNRSTVERHITEARERMAAVINLAARLQENA